MAISLVSPVLVGRRAESEALAGALERVLAGEATTVVVGGEAGVGKSRLVHELVGRARGAGVRVLVGGCVELDGGGIPFAPLVDMLRVLARDTPADELDALLGPARAVVGRLVPELDDPTAAPGREDAQPDRILELLLGVVSRLAGERPLMLAFEDVQWADRSTLDLIALLVAGASGRPLLLAFTARSDELHRAHPFRRMAARWEQQRAVERLELERLDARDVAGQIEAILGERPDGELVNLIFERSEGIPLFVEELLGAVRDGGADEDYLPPSLRDVLLARADRLPDDAREILRVASAAARWVPERLLALVAGMDEPRLYAALRQAVEHQLLVVDPTGRGYGFRHALARAAIHDDLLPGEKASLHRAYAEAVEANPQLAGPGLDATSMLAHHWLAAHDLPRALSAAVQAGHAAAGTSPAAAQRHFELALELWHQVPDAELRAGGDHAALLAAAAQAAYKAGAVDRSLALVDEALGELDPDAIERRAPLLVQRATVLTDLGREEEALAELEQTVPDDASSRAATTVLNYLARAMVRVDRVQRGGVLGRRAMTAARASGAREEELDAQLTVAHSMIYAGDVEGGLALAGEAADAARAEGWTYLAARAHVNQSDVLLMLGRYEEAVRTAEAGLPLTEQAGIARTAGAFLRSNRAEGLLRMGRLEEAAAAAAPGTEAPGVFTGGLLLARAEAHLLAGRRADAERDLREARRQLKSSTAPQFVCPLTLIETQLAREAGDLEAARAALARAPARADRGEEPRHRWPLLALAMAVEAERALAARDHGVEPPADATERAAELRAEGEAMTASTPADRAQLALLRAEHARLAGSGEAAAWADATAAWRAAGEPHPLGVALFRQAEALAADGDASAAAAAAEEAAEIARRIGAAPLLGEVEALMRRARLRVAAAAGEDGPDAPALGLTAREVDVLRLVADGFSNRQIADRLFISPKTASVHVSNILGKLGVTTRVQAAAVAHRAGLTRT